MAGTHVQIIIYIDISYYSNKVMVMAENIVHVFGGEVPCARCRATEKVVLEAAKELNLNVNMKYASALSPEADKYDIMATPAVVINGKNVFSGKVPDKETMKGILKREFMK